MMLEEDPEAQQAIKDALAQMASDGQEPAPEPTVRPQPTPGFDDAGSYMSPSEIAQEPPPSMTWKTTQEAPPVEAQGDIVGPSMRGDMALGQSSSVTDTDRREQVSRSEDRSGFDWKRALWAAAGGDIAAFDRGRAQREQAPYDRANALQEQMDADKQRQLVRDAMDPQSQLSKQRQQEYAAEMQMRSDMFSQSGQPSLAERYAEEAKRAGTMSATQIDRSSQKFGGLLKEQIDMRKAAAQEELGRQGQEYKQNMLNATIGNQQAGRAIEGAKLGQHAQELSETARHHQALEANQKENAHKIHLTSDQQKLVAGITSGINQIANIDKVLPQSEKYAAETKSQIPGLGKSGILSGPIQSLKTMANMSTDPEYVKWRGAIQRLFSVEKKQFAGVTVTPAEMEGLRFMIPDFNKDSEAAIVEKLKSAREFLKTKIENDKGGIKVDANGNPIDPSIILKQFAPGLSASVSGNKTVQEVSGGKPSMPVGKRATNPETGEQLEWDGKSWQPVKQ